MSEDSNSLEFDAIRTSENDNFASDTDVTHKSGGDTDVTTKLRQLLHQIKNADTDYDAMMFIQAHTNKAIGEVLDRLEYTNEDNKCRDTYGDEMKIGINIGLKYADVAIGAERKLLNDKEVN